ncbi:hypothetical protein PLICRDRAFT_44497 [Plicaturopsis crispa FD-325 SS-3]|nr:hypothetical protein PLICRDRAFT_44497 [Plicaturopsis crispa FD-325 SS-3]
MRQPTYDRVSQDGEDLLEDAVSTSARGRSPPRSIRPPVYYGEGPFDAPSSDEDEALLEKEGSITPGLAERGGNSLDEGGLTVGGHKRRPSLLRYLVVTLISLVILAGCIGVFAAKSYTGTSYRVPGAQRITMDHVFNGTFAAHRQSLNWVAEAGDGVFSISQDGYIKLVDLKTNSTKVLVDTRDIKDESGNTLHYSNWQLSADMKYILVKANYKKQWRHSSFGNYYVHDLEAGTTHPIIPPTDPPTTSFATWSPSGESLAYVTDNDLYVLTSPAPSTAPIRITTSGNASLFHGVPDWVYEEEVFSTDSALWWSPDSSKLAFLAFDETSVDEYSFPIYNPTEDSNAVIPYTTDITMKYPKPGYSNPLVSVHVFDVGRYLRDEDVVVTGMSASQSTLELDWEGRHPVEDSVIAEVAWVGNATLIVKELNRNANNGSMVLFDLDATDRLARTKGRIVRKLGSEGEQGDEGWVESAQHIYALPDGVSSDGPAYLDIVPSPDGYDHIALFSPASSGTPRFLTSGSWEVAGGIQAVDVKAGLVYFQAANPSSIERHLYSVPIPTSASFELVEPTSLTDSSVPSFYATNFSPQAGFYLLSYQGPNVPWQRVIQANNTAFNYILTDNQELNATYSQFESPVITYSTIESDGFELNVKEIRPPRMDDSGRTKYPVLFRVYGGPGSQMVDMRFDRDWHHYAACGLQYIVVVVDGRGTGYKGRKLRNPVKSNLGFWETKDQINAARIWAAKEYVDPRRIGIWGWSYGGFMSSKVVEADAGIHSLAIAVAPVTSWRLYDTIYTERYMNLPDLNPGGYVNASIANVTAFSKVDYLLMHGTGDDNVHFANSAHLLDMLTHAQVRNFRFRMFTDSDHSINRRGANREVYEYMTAFLLEKWGKGGKRRGW